MYVWCPCLAECISLCMRVCITMINEPGEVPVGWDQVQRDLTLQKTLNSFATHSINPSLVHCSLLPTHSYSSPIRHSASAAECYRLNGLRTAAPFLSTGGDLHLVGRIRFSPSHFLCGICSLSDLFRRSFPEASFGDLLSPHNCLYIPVWAAK